MENKGFLISFEGISGAGKTTLINEFKPYLEEKGFEVVLKRDLASFDDSSIGKDIKNILDNGSLDNPFFQFGYPIVETLLILAKRAYESQKLLQPALLEGKIIVADRDIDTVCVYQAVSILKLSPFFSALDLINIIQEIDSLSIIPPNFTFYLNVPINIAAQRKIQRDNECFSKEQIAFLKDVKKMYRKVLKIPINNREVKTIDAKDSIQKMKNKAIFLFEKWLKHQIVYL